MQVIEYIRFLQEKEQKYEASFPEWNEENAKLLPWVIVFRIINMQLVLFKINIRSWMAVSEHCSVFCSQTCIFVHPGKMHR
jgi:hypothetical protein